MDQRRSTGLRRWAGRLAPPVVGLLVAALPVVAGAQPVARDPAAVLRAYEDAWNRHDDDAVLALFAYDGRAVVLGGGAASTMQRRDWLRNRVMIQWCPATERCRVEMTAYEVDGESVRWRHRMYSSAAPAPLDPWDGTGEALVRAGRITFLQLTPSPGWETMWRAADDARAKEEMQRMASEMRRLHPTATARAAAGATATAEARLQEPRPPDTQLRLMPSLAMWSGASALLVLSAVWAALKR